jgi:hypothetical protein
MTLDLKIIFQFRQSMGAANIFLVPKLTFPKQ